MFAKIDCPASMGQPPHDDFVGGDHLLAVDAEVLPRLAWPARDGESPGDERPRVLRPACLDRKSGEIDILALPRELLTRRSGDFLRGHVHDLFSDRDPTLEHVAKSAWRLGLLEKSEENADIAQGFERICRGVGAHRERDAASRAEQVAENRYRVALGFLEEQRGATRFEHPVADLGYLQIGIDFGDDALELTRALELGQ